MPVLYTLCACRLCAEGIICRMPAWSASSKKELYKTLFWSIGVQD